MSVAPNPIDDGDDRISENESARSLSAARATVSVVLFASRPSAPQRLRRLGVAGTAVLLALILLFAGNSALWQQALAVTGIGSSAARVSANRYYLAVDVLWAS